MPSCLFVGGSLDGVLREIGRDDGWYETPVMFASIGVRTSDFDPYQQPQFAIERYRVANGIARHESLTEAQVAQRLAANYGKPDKAFSDELLVAGDALEEAGGIWAEYGELCRRAANQPANKLQKLDIQFRGHGVYVDCPPGAAGLINQRFKRFVELHNENLGLVR